MNASAPRPSVTALTRSEAPVSLDAGNDNAPWATRRRAADRELETLVMTASRGAPRLRKQARRLLRPFAVAIALEELSDRDAAERAATSALAKLHRLDKPAPGTCVAFFDALVRGYAGFERDETESNEIAELSYGELGDPWSDPP